MKRFLLATLLLAPGAARAADAAKEAPMVMSPYEVRADSVEFKSWIKVGSPNFIVYTDAGESDATRVLRELEMLRSAGQTLFNRRVARFSPAIVILPTAHSDWRKLEAKGNGLEWKSIATVAGGRIAHAVVVGYDWQDDGMGPVRAVESMMEQQDMGLAGPFWFTRGFGSYYETAEFSGNHVNLGHPNPRMLLLGESTWIPWNRFFEITQGSPEFTQEKQVDIYEGQAALFTQYLFSNPDGNGVPRLEAWLDYLRTGAPPTEAKFTEIFGQDFVKWQRTMTGYLAGLRSFTMFQITVPPEIAHLQVKKYDLPQREVRELFIITQILMQGVPESETSLDALLAKGLKSPSLRELLVDACLTWQKNDAALQYVRQLIAEGSTNSHVYRVGDALLTRDESGFGLDTRMGAEMPEVRRWDRKGIQQEPLDTELERSLAINEACAARIDQQSITTIEACYLTMKGRAATDEVLMALAMALWRSGDTETANTLAVKLRDDPLVQKDIREIGKDLAERIRTHAAPLGG